VVDEAGILSPAVEASLTRELEDLQTATGREMVVATVTSLEGREIEDYGYRLGRAWGVGSAERDDGVLLIVAPKERKVRIEVGYGLEGVLTDALSSVIIQTAILPKFRNGDLEGGIVSGVEALERQLRLPDEQARAALADTRRTEAMRKSAWWVLPLLKFAIVMFVTVFIPLLWSYISGLFAFTSWRPREIRRRSSGLVDWDSGSYGGGGPSGGGYYGGGGSFGGGGASGSW